MKLKSLFLATLAAMAMVSCSNDNDPINADGGNGEKNALLNFGIALPASTRAVTDGGTDVGTTQESKVNNITLILNYQTTGVSQFKKTYPVSAFTYENGKYELTVKEPVSPGIADVVVYVNGDPADATITSTSEFDLGTYASTAGDGNFFMTGEQKSLPIVANSSDNQASVIVERVAAKLSEATVQPEFTFEIENSALTYTGDLSIKLTDYTFSNLNKKSNVLAAASTYYNANDFWNKFIPSDTEGLWSSKFTVSNSISATNKVTYCFENNSTGANSAPTKVYYKAKVTLDGVTGNFYVYEGIIYKTFADLDAAKFNNSLTAAFGLDDTSSNSEFMAAVGVMKYTGGVCYYSADIKTVSGANIIRNNSYVLKVTSIADLGLPEIDTPLPGAPTLLGLDVTVKNWTVHKNDIEL